VSAPNFTALLTIDRTQDLVVSWTPLDADQITIYLSSGPPANGLAGDSVSLACSYAASLGAGALPAAAMAALPPSGTDRTATLQVSADNRSTVTVGDFALWFSAGASVQNDVTLE
jgi:hypothetical protein